LALLLLASANIAQADTAVWHWDRDSAVCSLVQDVGKGDKLEITRTPANGQTGLQMILKSTRRAAADVHDGTLALEPRGAASGEVQLREYDGKLYVNVVTQDPTFPDRFSGSSAVQISGGRIEPLRVTVQSAAAAVQALRKCEDDHMREWGIDPVAWHALRSAPVPTQSLPQMFNDFDYPLDAITFLVTGDAVTQLDIAVDGTVTQCKSLNASKYKGFEDATCRILRRARFKPALDASGRPVPAPYVIDVRFRIGR
jgi:TonB family protein